MDERQNIQMDLEELRTERQRSRLDMAKAREAGMISERWKRENCKEQQDRKKTLAAIMGVGLWISLGASIVEGGVKQVRILAWALRCIKSTRGRG